MILVIPELIIFMFEFSIFCLRDFAYYDKIYVIEGKISHEKIDCCT